MRAIMGLHKDRHGTYYARHKVPPRLQKVVAQLLDNGKPKQVWLKRSLGTKVLSEANVRGKPVQMEFDRIIAEAEAQLKERPLRTSLTDTEIKRIAEFFYAHELAADEELREDTRGSDPIYKDIHRQLTEAGIEFVTPFDLDSLTLEPGKGLSPRMMHKIEESIAIVLPAIQQALARGDISIIRYEVDELLKVFQINLDPTSASYRKLARAVMEAFVKAMKAKQERNKGEPVPTPPLVLPSTQGAVTGDTLHEALEGWKKERNPSRGVLAEYERAIRLFGELHGELPVAQIKRTHARSFREALQDLPRHRAAKLLHASLPELAEWGREHPEAPKITAATVNKLLGGVQTIALWAYDKGMVPDDIPWSDPFAKMRLREDAPERDAFTIPELKTLFASPVFTKGERPKPGRGEAAFWLPLLGLYTGARRGELASLTVKDVRKVDGVVAFTFIAEKATGKTLKTRSSARTVPVHLQLVKLGFLAYVDKVRRGHGESAWLFSQVAPNVPGGLKAWTKWFNRYLRSIGITDKRKVFHSFRHNFKDALRSGGVPEDLNDALTGHSNMSVGRGYGAKEILRRFGTAVLKDAVYAVNYKGLSLPKISSERRRKSQRGQGKRARRNGN
jgi:integrase